MAQRPELSEPEAVRDARFSVRNLQWDCRVRRSACPRFGSVGPDLTA